MARNLVGRLTHEQLAMWRFLKLYEKAVLAMHMSPLHVPGLKGNEALILSEIYLPFPYGKETQKFAVESVSVSHPVPFPLSQ